MSVLGSGVPPSSSTRPVTMIRSPIASVPVPMFVVKSLSSALAAPCTVWCRAPLSAGPGPVISDKVYGSGMSGCFGARRVVARYASYRYGGNVDGSRPGPSLWFALSAQMGLGHRKRCVRRGNAGVDGDVEQHLDNLFRIDADVTAGAQVQGQFSAPQRRQDADRHQAPGAPLPVRSPPHGSPRRLGDEPLEIGIEISLLSSGAGDVFRAEHLRAHLHPCVVAGIHLDRTTTV